MTEVPGAPGLRFAQQKAEDPAPNYPAPSNSGILLVGTGHGGMRLFRAGQAEEKRTPARVKEITVPASRDFAKLKISRCSISNAKRLEICGNYY